MPLVPIDEGLFMSHPGENGRVLVWDYWMNVGRIPGRRFLIAIYIWLVGHYFCAPQVRAFYEHVIADWGVAYVIMLMTSKYQPIRILFVRCSKSWHVRLNTVLLPFCHCVPFLTWCIIPRQQANIWTKFEPMLIRHPLPLGGIEISLCFGIENEKTCCTINHFGIIQLIFPTWCFLKLTNHVSKYFVGISPFGIARPQWVMRVLRK